ncbi:MAG: phosphoenolpyruvate carboxykinase domain-containing protein, partial [Roseimicrobium sp.]
WIVNRCRGRGKGHETQIGWMPRMDEVNLEGLEVSLARWEALMQVDLKEFRHEVLTSEELYLDLYDSLPKELIYQRELLAGRF